MGRWGEVLFAALRLGLTSFGGPIAHLGYFREEYVVRRRWLSEANYADLVALCQFLPGPASSQVGIAVGIARAGIFGGFAAWVGFTLPSALVLILFAYGTQVSSYSVADGWLRGLKVVAVAVVAQAVWGMARTLCPDRRHASVTILAAIALLLWQSPYSQVSVIVLAGLIGWMSFTAPASASGTQGAFLVTKPQAITAWALFFVCLFGLPFLTRGDSGQALDLFAKFFRVGSLVFGGGHVVLPLLQAEVVGPGWITRDQFVAGYGATQAVPGPLFTFSAYLGTLIGGWRFAVVALVGIFLPSFFLVVGALPFWEMIRRNRSFRAVLGGINAAVVGLLLAALYTPVWTTAVHGPADFSLLLAAFGLLEIRRCQPWIVVVLTCLGAEAMERI